MASDRPDVVGDTGGIELLCLDLDGTIVESDDVHYWLADEAVETLNTLGRRGVRWCSNSGRSRPNQMGLIQACRALENMPVAILAGEREIYWCRTEFRSHEPFNSRLEKLVRDLRPRTIEALGPHMERLRASYGFARDVENTPVVGWRLADKAEAARFVDELEEVLTGLADAQVLRNGSWVVVTHAAVGKGVVLTEAASHLGIAAENILAIGDQCNDLDMLDGKAARQVGCPSNADEAVKSLVTAAGGHVSAAPGPNGTLDVIRRFVQPQKR